MATWSNTELLLGRKQFFWQDLGKLKDYIVWVARIDTPQGGIIPRSQYEALEQQGISTPLRSKPEYPEYLNSLLILFWDLISFKEEFDTYLSLSEIDAYIRLLDEQINPFHIRILCQFDKAYTNTVLEVLRSTT